MSAPPPRRSERGPAVPPEYYEPQPYTTDPRRPYDQYAPPPPSRHPEDRPPRRHKSERRRPISPEPQPYEKPSRRRQPSPDFPPYDPRQQPSRRRQPSPGYPDFDAYQKPSRRRQASPEYAPVDPYEKPRRRRGDPKAPPPVINGGSRHAHGGPEALTPPHAPEPPRPDRAHKHRDPERHRRADRQSMPPPRRDDDAYGQPYGAAAAPMDGRRDVPRSSRDPYLNDPYERPHRRPRSPPPAGPRGRDPYEARTRDRSRGAPRHDDAYGAPLPHRPRSQVRGSPPPRERAPPAKGGGRPSGGKSGGRKRRMSMPAAITKGQIGGAPWWQNPHVQNGARQALTAGAQAAFRSKDEQGPWLGPKGAKVATAALSAAFVDGLFKK